MKEELRGGAKVKADVVEHRVKGHRKRLGIVIATNISVLMPLQRELASAYPTTL